MAKVFWTIFIMGFLLDVPAKCSSTTGSRILTKISMSATPNHEVTDVNGQVQGFETVGKRFSFSSQPYEHTVSQTTINYSGISETPSNSNITNEVYNIEVNKTNATFKNATTEDQAAKNITKWNTNTNAQPSTAKTIQERLEKDIGGIGGNSLFSMEEIEIVKNTQNASNKRVKVELSMLNSYQQPTRRSMVFLNSAKPETNTIPENSHLADIEVISSKKLVIVIVTVFGTMGLFIILIIIIVCCRRNAKIEKKDSAASKQSVTSNFSNISSVISSGSRFSKKSNLSKRSSTSNISAISRPISETCCTTSDGFTDIFMGIPANNNIWKELDTLPEGASSVIPESTHL